MCVGRAALGTHGVQGAEQQDALHGVTQTGALLVRLGEHRLRTEVGPVSGRSMDAGRSVDGQRHQLPPPYTNSHASTYTHAQLHTILTSDRG